MPPPPSRTSGSKPSHRVTNGLAVAALVCGIIGVIAGAIPLLFFLAWVLGVIALVLGFTGRSASKRRDGAGRKQATAGVILGAVAVILGVVGVVILNNIINDTETKIRESARTPHDEPSRSPSTFFPTTTTTAPRAKTFAVGDKVAYQDGSSIQLFTYEQPVPQGRFSSVEPGNELAVIDVEFCAATSGRAFSYNDLGFKAQMADNRQYEATYGGRDPDLGSGDLPPGAGCKRGFVTLKVPQGQRPAFVLWDYSGTEQARWTV